ncbi:MAG TPA: SGNH/GDSL hydrolase family protein [Methylomirabilota bacterium]|nr:SGNH/GDSL hydrolase family protein [Methylomirabilota bacterium]
MSRPVDRPPGTRVTLEVLGTLTVLELGALLCALAVHRGGWATEPPIDRARAAFAVGLLAAGTAGALLGIRFRRAGRAERRLLWYTLCLQAFTVAGVCAVAEATVRVLATTTAQGPAFAGIPLLPHRWELVRARYRRVLATAPNAISYLVPDPLLGWTIGPGRESRDGLYASSREGIRGATPGVGYASHATARRIALVGDSYTFGLEVPFADSWGVRLQEALGPGVDVLNFGVDGYGIDQAYLRFRRDAAPWRPEVAILGFIDHDLYRSMAVYAFVSFPEWGFPFAKPRFVLAGERLRLANVPLPEPEAILARDSIAELPFVELDPGYDAAEWQWRAYAHSYLARYLLSRFPRRVPARPAVSEAAREALNRAILAAFAESAAAAGAIPLVVYFPTRSDFGRGDRRVTRAMIAALRRGGLEVLDLTSCLRAVPEPALFLRFHYSPAGNARVADCLEPAVRAALDRHARAGGRAGAPAGPRAQGSPPASRHAATITPWSSETPTRLTSPSG